ncbi:MAG: hypothetical protein RIA62_18480 [Cyclobacteriaceae bacterium]
MENRIHLQINQQDQKAIEGALKTLADKLGPHLKTLDTKERRSLPKMADGTVPFVEKALSYAQSNPQFLPPYVKVEDIKVDLDSVELLTGYRRKIDQLLQSLEDTATLAGSEAYVAALSYYQSVKLGERLNMPGAGEIYKDLQTRFK